MTRGGIRPEVVAWPDLDIAELLVLERVEDGVFSAWRNEDNGVGRIFGGQILAQTMMAARQTVDVRRPVHSMFLSFCGSGRPRSPMRYLVSRESDGATTSVRSVRGLQVEKPVCTAIVSCQKPGEAFEYQESAGESWSTLASATDISVLADRYPAMLGGTHILKDIAAKGSVDMRLVDAQDYFERAAGRHAPANYRCWMRSARQLPDDPSVHQAAIAYLTDFVLAQVPPLREWSYAEMGHVSVASINHGLWFYRPVRADDWLLVDAVSPVAAAGRGFVTARVWDARERRIAAVVTQECVYRVT